MDIRIENQCAVMSEIDSIYSGEKTKHALLTYDGQCAWICIESTDGVYTLVTEHKSMVRHADDHQCAR